MIGFGGFPYFVIFELFGPLIQIVGLPVTIYAYATGRLSLPFLIGFLVVSLLLGVLLSVAAIALEEFNFRRHPSTRDVIRLLVFSVGENIGYRQLNDVWRLLAFVDLARRRRTWGAQRRRGFGARDSAAR